MRQMSIARKVFWIGASFSLPIGVLVWLMVSSINSYIDFANKEIWGNQVQRPLEEMMEAVMQHRMTWMKCHESGCGSSLGAPAAGFEAGYARLKREYALYAAPLELTEQGFTKRGRKGLSVEALGNSWKSLEKKVADGASAGEVNNAYASTVSELRGFISHVGDTSNLILDPDLDSYYLMDVTLLALPQGQDRIGKLARIGLDNLKGETKGQEGLTSLAVAAALMQESDLERTEASTKTALNEDQNFYGVSAGMAEHLAAPLEEYRRASAHLISLARSISEGKAVAVGDFENASRAASAASFAYWRTAVAELDRLLGARIASYQSQRAVALVLALLSVLIACGIAWWIAVSINKPLGGLIHSLGPGATMLSNCARKISETTQAAQHDPQLAEIICEELNAHCDSMRGAVLELARHVEGAGSRVGVGRG